MDTNAPNTVVKTPEIAEAAKTVAKKIQTDAFVNAMTGIGTDRSKYAYAYYNDDPPLPMDTLESLYANSDLAAIIVNKIIEDALRDGFRLHNPELDEEQSKAVTKAVMYRWVELQKHENRFFRGAAWGRLFGGGGVILGVDGAGALTTPLKDDKVTSVRFIIDTNRQELVVNRYYPDGTPETYIWTPTRSGGSKILPTEVHESRVMLFPGAVTTAKRRQINEGWDLSVLQRVYEALLSFDSMWANTDAMFADASQAVFHMQGLIQALAEDGGAGAGGGQSGIRNRLALMDMGRSAAKAVVLDAGDEGGAGREDFKVVDRASLGGLDGVQQNYMVRLATAARMPLTVLLGMSPAGMDATGESDMILWFNTVDEYRRTVLEERVLRLCRMLMQELAAESNLPIGEVDEWCIVWPDLYRPKPLDVQTAESMRVQSVNTLITAQVITPEEAALNLSQIAPSLGLQIDPEPRRKAMEAAMVEIEERTLGQAPVAEGEDPGAESGADPQEKMTERKTPSATAGQQV